MRFSKISITKKGVDLTRETRDGNGCVEDIHLNSPERPLPSFADALQAFLPYVEDLLDGTIDIDAEAGATITTLNLSEDKNGLRGLIVTAIVPIEKAYEKPIVLNTPLVREGGELPLDEAFVLSDEVMDLITVAEKEATAYAGGKRMKEAAATPSENAKDFDKRAAAAEVASTRKPKGSKGPKTPKGTATPATKAKAKTNGKGGTHAPHATSATNGKRGRVKRDPDARRDATIDRAHVATRGDGWKEPWGDVEAPPTVTDEGAQAVQDAAARG